MRLDVAICNTTRSDEDQSKTWRKKVSKTLAVIWFIDTRYDLALGGHAIVLEMDESDLRSVHLLSRRLGGLMSLRED